MLRRESNVLIAWQDTWRVMSALWLVLSYDSPPVVQTKWLWETEHSFDTEQISLLCLCVNLALCLNTGYTRASRLPEAGEERSSSSSSQGKSGMRMLRHQICTRRVQRWHLTEIHNHKYPRSDFIYRHAVFAQRCSTILFLRHIKLLRLGCFSWESQQRAALTNPSDLENIMILENISVMNHLP